MSHWDYDMDLSKAADKVAVAVAESNKSYENGWQARPWGSWKVLADYGTFKVKELVVNPHSTLSYQKHKFRSEYWIPRLGSGILITSAPAAGSRKVETVEVGLTNKIPQGTWHQLSNPTTKELHIIEIQFGEKCIEEDIERWQYE